MTNFVENTDNLRRRFLFCHHFQTTVHSLKHHNKPILYAKLIIFYLCIQNMTQITMQYRLNDKKCICHHALPKN